MAVRIATLQLRSEKRALRVFLDVQRVLWFSRGHALLAGSIDLRFIWPLIAKPYAELGPLGRPPRSELPIETDSIYARIPADLLRVLRFRSLKKLVEELDLGGDFKFVNQSTAVRLGSIHAYDREWDRVYVVVRHAGREHLEGIVRSRRGFDPSKHWR
jgi:hypothetical protein